MWDATITGTVDPPYLHAIAVAVGDAAELAATRRIAKYDHLLANYNFVPMAFDTLGPNNISGLDLIKELSVGSNEISSFS